MPNNVDTRIVEMEFDNAQFERGAKTTLSTLDNLNAKVDKMSEWSGDDFGRGLSNGLGNVTDGLDKCMQGMTAFEQFSFGVFSRLGQKVTDLGLQVANELFVAQKKAGFGEYELELGSVQTIQASTGKDFNEIYGYLGELNKYADQTIYSFKDMTANIGKFTNAGVDLDVAVKAIQGISNEAALSGANAQEASRAMYNFSQALSSGYVKLIDWKSIENANMATVGFKQTLLDTALELGTVVKEGNDYVTTTTNMKGDISEAFNATKGFNDALSYQWMTSEVLTKALGKYSDETTDIGKRAFAAAQDVKSFSQMMDTLKEAAGSGWSETFRLIFGEFEDAKKLWTGVSNTLGGVVDAFSNLRNHALRYWKQEGGRTKLLNSLVRLWKIFDERVKIIGESFKAAFPAINKTGHILMKLTNQFSLFTKSLKNGLLGNKESLDKFRESTDHAFRGIRLLLKSIRIIARTIRRVFLTALKAVREEMDGVKPAAFIFERIAATIFKAAKAFRAWVTDSKRLEYVGIIAKGLYSAFQLIVEIVSQVISAFKPMRKETSSSEPVFLKLIARVSELITKFTEFTKRTRWIENSITKLIDIFKKFTPIIEGAKASFSSFKDGDVLSGLGSITRGFKTFFANIFSGFGKFKKTGKELNGTTKGVAKSSTNFVSSLTASFGSFFSAISKLFSKLKTVTINAFSGFRDTISKVFKTTGKSTEKAAKEAEKPVTGLTWITEQLWKGFEWFLKQFEKVGKMAGDAIKNFFGGFGLSFKKQEKEVVHAGEAPKSMIQTVIDGIKDAINKIKEGINLTEITSTFGEGLKKVWLGLTEDPLLTAMVAGWLQMINIAKTLVSPIKDFGDAVDKVTDDAGRVLKSTSGLIDGLKGSVAAWKHGKMADTFKDIAIALLLVAVSIGIITLAFSKDGAAATAGLGAAIGMLLEMSAIVKGLAKAFPNPIDISNATSAMLKMSIALLIMSMAIKGMAKAGEGNVAGLSTAVLAMVLLMGMMSEVIQSLIKNTPNPKMLASASDAMIKMAVSFLIISKAVTKMAKAGKDGNMASLVVSILGLVVIIAAMAKTVEFLTKTASNLGKDGKKGIKVMAEMISMMIGVAAAAYIISLAVAKLAKFDTASLTRGLVGIVAILAMTFSFTKALANIKINEKAMTSSITLIGTLSYVVYTFAGVVERFAKMKPDELKTGLIGFGAIVAALSVFLVVISKTSKDIKPAKMTAATQSLILAAIAMAIISSAIKNLAGLSFEDLGPGCAMLAAMLVVIFGALLAMSKLGGVKNSVSLAGAVVVIAIAIGILEKTLEKLQTIQFSKIKGGLLAMGLMMAAIVVMSYFATPLQQLAIALLGFGAAIFLVGSGVKRIADAFKLFAKTLILLATSWGIMEPVIDAILTKLAASIPYMASAAVEGIRTLAIKIAEAAPDIGKALRALIKETLKTLYGWVPEFVEEMLPIIIRVLKLLKDNSATIFGYVFDILIDLLTELSKRMSTIMELLGDIVYDIVIGALDTVIKRQPELLEKLYDFLISLIYGLAEMFDDEHVDAFIEAGNKLVDNLIDALIKVVNASQDKIMEIGPRITDGLIKGAISRSKRFGQRVWRMIKGAISIGDDRLKKILEEGKKIGKQIVAGLVKGLKEKWKDVKENVEMFGESVLETLGDAFKIASPSKATAEMGKYLDLGLAQGITKCAKVAEKASEETVNGVLDSFNSIDYDNLLNGDPTINPTITPVINGDSLNKSFDAAANEINKHEMELQSYTPTLTFGSTSTELSQQTYDTVNASFNDETKQMYDELKSAIEDLTEMLDGMILVDENTNNKTILKVDGETIATATAPYFNDKLLKNAAKAKTKTAMSKK